MMIKLRHTITFYSKAKNSERYYQNVLHSTFSIWQKGAHFMSNFLLFALINIVCHRGTTKYIFIDLIEDQKNIING